MAHLPDKPGWQPITPEETRSWRRDLPKGHVREVNTAHTVGLDSAESDGDAAFMEKPPVPVIDDARKVVNDLRDMAINWATANRENAAVAVKMIRASNPEAFRHKSDEDMIDMIVSHYEEKIQEVTASVYRDDRNRWDKGNLVDVKDGVWRP